MRCVIPSYYLVRVVSTRCRTKFSIFNISFIHGFKVIVEVNVRLTFSLIYFIAYFIL